jgi:hypothetical protein
MLINLSIGIVTVFITMGIQIAAVVYMLQYLFKLLSRKDRRNSSRGRTAYVISMMMTLLLAGHLIQVAVWAFLFMQLGEFNNYATAFYHSMVNFASLGYGDIVMSDNRRLLGAIEASAGVLMFGLSAGALLSIMSFLLTHSGRFKDQLVELHKHDQKKQEG